MERLAYAEPWLQASDFTEEGTTLTIDKVEVKEIAPDVFKTVVFFKEDPRGLVLNEINRRIIEHNTRIPSDRWDEWAGYKITPYASEILMKDQPTPCIRVKILVDEVAFKEDAKATSG